MELLHFRNCSIADGFMDSSPLPGADVANGRMSDEQLLHDSFVSSGSPRRNAMLWPSCVPFF
jgi:hypothetical protein